MLTAKVIVLTDMLLPACRRSVLVLEPRVKIHIHVSFVFAWLWTRFHGRIVLYPSPLAPSVIAPMPMFTTIGVVGVDLVNLTLVLQILFGEQVAIRIVELLAFRWATTRRLASRLLRSRHIAQSPRDRRCGERKARGTLSVDSTARTW